MMDWTQLITQFHWLRPYWLLALVPVILLALLLWRQTRRARQWSQLVEPELLHHLVDPDSGRKRRSYVWALLVGWIVATLALAGPSWEKRPLPVHKNENALVIVLDLSPSMLAEDLTPSRLARARLKIADVLRLREDGFTGLVAYAGDAHVVSPLTDDTATINSLLSALHPNIMPQSGSNTEAAIAQAQTLMEDAGMSEGRILLITDGVVEAAERPILDRLQESGFRLSILGIGTPDGAPIPNERGGFERDRTGEVVVARLEEDRLERLAGRTGGRYTRIGDRNDIEWLLNQPTLGEERHRELEREFDTWYDRGHWLVLLLLPLILYSFRRGLLVLVVALPMVGLYPAPAQAADWQAPFLTPNQRGERRLQADDPEAAAEVFQDPEWLGSALYRAEDYEAAAEAFAQSDSARAHYNRGNALARAGDLEAALEAYDQALSQAPDMEDAQANKQLVEQLKEQQEQQQQDSDEEGESGEDGSDEQDQDGSDSDSDDSGQPEDSEQNQSDSQSGDQEDGQSGDQDDGQQNPSEPDDQDPENDRDSPGNPEGDEQDEGEQQDREQGQTGEQEEESDESNEEMPAPATLEDSDLSDEERQAMDQWLRRIPDDPGGLLRRKFEHQSQERRLERYRGETQTQAPDAEERW